jgi:hypothetical protein
MRRNTASLLRPTRYSTAFNSESWTLNFKKIFEGMNMKHLRIPNFSFALPSSKRNNSIVCKLTMFFVVIPILLITAGCWWDKPKEAPSPPQNLGIIVVHAGYGYVPTADFCGVVSASVVLSNGQSKQITIGQHLPLPNPPVCRGSVVFDQLPPGTYRVGDYTCPITLSAGQIAGIYIRTDVGTCTTTPWL